MPTLVSHVWKPSKARVITIDSFIPVPRGTAAAAPALLSWPSKDPADILDYQLNIEPALIGNSGDAIEDVDVEVTPSQAGDLTVNSVSADGYKIVLWMSAGQAGSTYTVTIRVALASGRTLQRSLLLPVVALSLPSVPADAIKTSTQDALTDQNGDPITTDDSA